ncbi:MAG: DNA-binding protein [Eubacterium sp.]|nr:DNA-binding protein [Eubacterium sp.]
MDTRLRQSLLYDFYGELLNDHQKEVFSAAIFDDMSYSELAEEYGVSRQAAFDLVRRINKKLERYEESLGLLNRFTVARDKMDELTQSVESLKDMLRTSDIDSKISRSLSKQLDDISGEAKEVFDSF